MAKTKLELAKLTLTEKIELARQIVLKMTGNAAFTTPMPPLPALTTYATAAETAFNDAEGARVTAKQKTVVQNTNEDALAALLTQLAAYVENASAGDEAKILSAGMGVRAARTPSAVPQQVLALSATEGDNEGTIDLAWDPVDQAVSYSIELSTTSAGGGHRPVDHPPHQPHGDQEQRDGRWVDQRPTRLVPRRRRRRGGPRPVERPGDEDCAVRK